MKIIPSQSAEEAHRAYLDATQGSLSGSGAEAGDTTGRKGKRFVTYLAALLGVALLGVGGAYIVPMNFFRKGGSEELSLLLKLVSPSSERLSERALASNLSGNSSGFIRDDEVARRLRLLDSSARSRLAPEVGQSGRVVEDGPINGEVSRGRDSLGRGSDKPIRDFVSQSEGGERFPENAVNSELPSGWWGRLQNSFALGSGEIRRNVFQLSRTVISGHSRLQEGYIRKLAGLPALDEEGETALQGLRQNGAIGSRGEKSGSEGERPSVPLSVLNLPLDRLSRSLKQSPWIEDVHLSVSYFPATLRLKIREAEPWLVVEMGGKTWLVSTLGQPLEALETLRDDEVILEASKLPRLDGISGGSQPAVNARFQYAVNILRLIEVAGGLPFAVDRYRLLEEGGVLATPSAGVDAPEVVLSAATLNQAEETLQKLKVVLDDLQSRGEIRTRVDMRFVGQAIVR